MAAKKHSYTMREWKDVAFLVSAFEEVNDVGVSFSICLERTNGEVDLLVSAMAFTKGSADVVPAPLALVEFKASATELITTNSLLTNVLYRLDAELARIAFEEEAKK